MGIPNQTLFFGDNLKILRERIPDEMFDLIYLDPPFNSDRNYNVLFKEGVVDSSAQIQAFEDTWEWTPETIRIFEELKTHPNPNIAILIHSLAQFIGHNQMMAYLVMMTVRLIELHRVLKPTGSLYLHCDPTAGHYLKILLDVIFGKQNFRNEIIWFYNGELPKGTAFKDARCNFVLYQRSEEHISHTLQPPSARSVKRWKGKRQLVTFNEQGRNCQHKKLPRQKALH